MSDYNNDTDNCVLGNTNKTRIDIIEKTIVAVCEDIKEIKTTLLGRPTWFVTLLFSCMLSLITSLIIYIVTTKA